MKVLLQRVSSAKVEVAGEMVGEIAAGLLLFLGVEPKDSQADLERMLAKVLAYRMFEDEEGRMNRSLLDVNGQLLVVSQFTLAANTAKGLRPSFSSAAPPEHGLDIYQRFIAAARLSLARDQMEGGQERIKERVQTGVYGADMSVSLCNEGPVTFLLEV